MALVILKRCLNLGNGATASAADPPRLEKAGGIFAKQKKQVSASVNMCGRIPVLYRGLRQSETERTPSTAPLGGLWPTLRRGQVDGQ